MGLSAAEYRETLRRYRPRVFVDGRAIESAPRAVAGTRHRGDWRRL